MNSNKFTSGRKGHEEDGRPVVLSPIFMTKHSQVKFKTTKKCYIVVVEAAFLRAFTSRDRYRPIPPRSLAQTSIKFGLFRVNINSLFIN